MATEVLMPRQGNTVESCIILSWKRSEGEAVAEGDVLCEVETDKATFEVEAPAGGTLLKVLHPEGADVPVLQLIAVIGEAGEDIDAILSQAPGPEPAAAAGSSAAPEPAPGAPGAPRPSATVAANGVGISPRARNLAQAKGLDTSGLAGSGPGGRVIERDVVGALGSRSELTPAAIAELGRSGGSAPVRGSGIGGRVLAADLAAAAGQTTAGASAAPADGAAGLPFPGPTHEIPLKGIRKRVADRMLDSLQTTAQVTLFMPADARAIRAYRARLKSARERSELGGINLNDMVMYAAARTVGSFPEMNAHLEAGRIVQFEEVHLGFAVDTERGLMVPVVRNADRRSLRELSGEVKRLASACLDGNATSDDLAGGTFTVTNLGAFGVEYFTPVLNPPQVGILGVGNISLKPVEVDGGQEFVPQLTLSLTFDHRAIDGAPAARFLKAVAAAIADFDLLLAE